MKIDIDAFQNSITRLEEGLIRYERDPSDTQIRDGLIQRFEFTYELAFRTLKRYLENTSASPDEYKDMSFQDIIRSGNERGVLLGDWPVWRTYRDTRSRTSHSYSEAVALAVVRDIPRFVPEARFLYDAVKARLG